MRRELGGRRRRRGSVNNLARTVDDKFRKVPLDVVAERSFAFLKCDLFCLIQDNTHGCCFHPSPQRMRVFAIDFDFLKKFALKVVFFHKFGDLLVTRRLLLAELVAREGK